MIDFVNVERLSNSLQQGDCQTTTQVLSEFLESLHESLNGGDFFVPQANSQSAQAVTDRQHVLFREAELER